MFFGLEVAHEGPLIGKRVIDEAASAIGTKRTSAVLALLDEVMAII
jgi:hypothetical protein